MRLTIVLNGGLKSCCSMYPPDVVRDALEQWLSGMCDVETIDAKAQAWTPDGLASLAIELFGETAYPFVYLDGTMMCAGYFPSRGEVIAMLSPESKIEGVTREEILAAARAQAAPEEGGAISGEVASPGPSEGPRT